MISKAAFQHYQIGIKDIDDEHWEILSRLEEFSISKTKEDDLRIVDEIASLWEEHSIKEENSMMKYDFPFTKYHLREHNEMKDRFNALHKKVSDSNYSDRHWIASELQVIVCNHIDRFDHQISEHINKHINKGI